MAARHVAALPREVAALVHVEVPRDARVERHEHRAARPQERLADSPSGDGGDCLNSLSLSLSLYIYMYIVVYVWSR